MDHNSATREPIRDIKDRDYSPNPRQHNNNNTNNNTQTYDTDNDKHKSQNNNNNNYNNYVRKRYLTLAEYRKLKPPGYKFIRYNRNRLRVNKFRLADRTLITNCGKPPIGKIVTVNSRKHVTISDHQEIIPQPDALLYDCQWAYTMKQKYNDLPAHYRSNYVATPNNTRNETCSGTTQHNTMQPGPSTVNTQTQQTTVKSHFFATHFL